MFQGKNFKILATSALVVALSHCQGASGKRVFGSQLTTLPNQTQGASTAKPQLGQQLLSAMFPGQKTTKTSDTGFINIINTATPDWNKLCSDIESATPDTSNKDTDKDGLSDKCEETLYAKGDFEYSALDPFVYNGALVGGRYINASDYRLDLSAQQNFNWKSNDAIYNSVGFGVTWNATKAIMKKVSAIADESGRAVFGFKDLYNNLSIDKAKIDSDFLSSTRSSELFKNDFSDFDDQNIGLVQGDGDEAIPYSPANTAKSSYNLTALTPKVLKAVLFEPIETHIVLPPKIDQMDIAIGHLSASQNRIEGSDRNLYYILNNGDLSSADGADQTASNFATIRKSPGCETAYTVIAHFSDARDTFVRNPYLKDGIYYRVSAADTWKPLSQGMISMQPRGGVACNKTFNITDPQHKNMFFAVRSAITSRVQGLNDFNTGLNPTDPLKDNDGRLAVSFDKNDTGNLLDILGATLGKGNLNGKALLVKDMDAPHIEQLEHALDVANARGLTPEEKSLYDEVRQAIADRKAALAAPVAKVQTDPKIIQLSENGTITLDYATMTCLSKLGFAFADEQGNVYLPKEGETKKITQAVLDQILEQIGKMLDEDKITPEQVDCLMTWFAQLQKDPNVDQQKLKDFLDKYNDQLSGLTPTGQMLAYLRALNKRLGLGIDKDIQDLATGDAIAKKNAHDNIYKTIEKKLLAEDAASLQSLSMEERLKIAQELNRVGFLSADEYSKLLLKLYALQNRINGKDKDTEVVEDEFGNLKLRNAKVLFDSGSNQITPNAEQVLKTIAQYISKTKTSTKDIYLRVDAYTDSDGTDAKNKTLSQYRAQSVAEFLAGKLGGTRYTYKGGKKGSNEFQDPQMDPAVVVPATNITPIGHGEESPIADNKTKTGKAKNRRVEITILKNKP